MATQIFDSSFRAWALAVTRKGYWFEAKYVCISYHLHLHILQAYGGEEVVYETVGAT